MNKTKYEEQIERNLLLNLKYKEIIQILGVLFGNQEKLKGFKSNNLWTFLWNWEREILLKTNYTKKIKGAWKGNTGTPRERGKLSWKSGVISRCLIIAIIFKRSLKINYSIEFSSKILIIFSKISPSIALFVQTNENLALGF